MTNESKLIIGVLTVIGGVCYVGYLHNKINKLSSMIDVAVDDLSSKTQVNISDAVLDLAVQKAVDREVGYISNRITRDLNLEIRTQVKHTVNASSSDIKKSVSAEIASQVKSIDISDMEREVVNKAKDAVAEKFDRKLDSLLDDFNDNLNNVRKIYSSIEKSIAKD